MLRGDIGLFVRQADDVAAVGEFQLGLSLLDRDDRPNNGLIALLALTVMLHRLPLGAADE